MHSVSFKSLLPDGSGKVAVEYDEHSGWSKGFSSVDAASIELSIPAEFIGKAMKRNTSLYTIVPIIDIGELLTPSGKFQALNGHIY
jgi:hypothetical protein